MLATNISGITSQLSEDRKYALRLLGAFQLTAPDGTDIRLGRKAQAILAFLAIEPGAPVTRARLQDLLWSRSGPRHGRDSLKKALQAIRSALGPQGAHIVTYSADRLWLVPEAVEVDLHAPGDLRSDRALLEGLDVEDPEFEDWLRQTRQSLETQEPRHCAPTQTNRYLHHQKALRMRLAVQAVQFCGSNIARLAGEVLICRLLDSLAHCDLINVCDLRGGDLQTLGAADANLSISAIALGSEVQLQLNVKGTADNTVIWSGIRQFGVADLGGALMQDTVSRFTDEIVFALGQASRAISQETHAVTRLAIEGIENLFRLKSDNLATAARCFSRAIDIEPRGSLFAWYAFLLPFRYEQSKGTDLNELREQAQIVVTRALKCDPHNPLVRALIAHVYGFVMRDLDRSNSMLSPLRAQPPSTPMYHFSESMLNLYQGNLAQARSHALTSASRGASHPYAYAFSTSLCMIDTIHGSASSAIAHGKRALAAMPTNGRTYEPTLRYLTAAYAQSGQISEARQTWDQLQSVNPANSLENLREARFPVAADHMRRALNDSYGAIGRALG